MRIFILLTLMLLLGSCSSSDNDVEDNTPSDEIRMRITTWEVISMVDDIQQIRTFIYDEEDRLKQQHQVNQLGGESVVNYYYDAEGKLTSHERIPGYYNTYYEYEGPWITHRSGIHLLQWEATYNYDSEGRLVEFRYFYENGELYCYNNLQYDEDVVPTGGSNDCFGGYTELEWDNKKSPFLYTYTEAFNRVLMNFPRNLVNQMSYSPNYTNHLHFDITYNSEGYPTEIKTIDNDNHTYTERFTYEVID